MSETGEAPVPSGGEIFPRLQALGVTHVFCNSGTDFPPIIEGLARAAAQGRALPRPVALAHEHVAMGMAHGAWLATGRLQAVMLHTNVGLANGAIGAINAAHDRAPIILMSGRTPVVEQGRFGARTVPIGWGQEMRDQAALVRESVKWDYELRFPEQLPGLLDRAAAIARSTPAGPVYLSLPREVLCEPIAPSSPEAPPMAPARAAPPPDEIARLARWIAEARNPVVIAQRGAGSAEGFAAMDRIARGWGLPVWRWWATALALPTDHPMDVGADPGPWIAEADLIVALDCLAPWQPDLHRPAPDARVVHLGPDPLQIRTPVRGFRADMALAGETAEILTMLEAALAPLRKGRAQALEARARKVAQAAARIRRAAIEAARAGGRAAPMSKAFVSWRLSAAIARAGREQDAAVFSELGCPLDPLTLRRHDAWRQEPHSGGLGFGLPAALGFQLAAPERLVFATMGDGSYMFANPVACHQAAEALGLPVIGVVLNNAEWGAVRQSALGLYPDGHAARANAAPLTSLDPSPDFAMVAAASRAHVETVETPDQLDDALDRAIAVAAIERRQALLDVRVQRSMNG
ncbi:thiamine pyrophosphate-requiring protein [Oceanicella actignis]|uniref:Acetolactate synthase-1/2/3 large subunit n=1 Tax=Oceanicella actignis TaxID=1189325 RepID=A0A1M7SVN0_9RHOB|nr:thiamine pyrophosphate-requiring protein [Oceanicella actignis]SES72699.1 acetolactate synthase-1/2/3 large subunit [Oceanicella actignis]SHN62444.1 acetolactate synthase-1/2/3 large subunit [Oceanicella actignis]